MAGKYPPEFQQRALRLLAECQEDHQSQWAAIQHVAKRLGIVPETLRRWLRQAEIDAGVAPGVTSSESAELKRRKRENAELLRANEILKTASAFFAAELDRPTTR